MPCIGQMNTSGRLSTGGGSRSRLGTAGGRETTPQKRDSTPLGLAHLGEQMHDYVREAQDGKQLYAETFKLDDMREELDEFVTYSLPQPSLPIGRPPSPKYTKAVKR